MNDSIYFYLMMALASVFAFLKLFNKTTSYTYFIIIGVIFSLLEFVFRIPSVDIGVKQLGYSVVYLQIVWVSMNFIMSSILGLMIYNDKLELEKVLGMAMILGGIYLASKESKL